MRIIASGRNLAPAVLGTVVVDFQVTVLGVAGQGFPARKRLSNGYPFRPLWQYGGLLSLQIRPDVLVVQVGYRFGLTSTGPPCLASSVGFPAPRRSTNGRTPA